MIMTAQQIEAAVADVASYYPAWTIGNTHDPDEACKTQGLPMVWHLWEARTEEDAREAVASCIQKGMCAAPEAKGRHVFAYIASGPRWSRWEARSGAQPG